MYTCGRILKKVPKEGLYVSKQGNCSNTRGGGEAVYGLGLIGAAIYFIQNADSFWAGALGLLKAIVWPAYVVYELLRSFFG